MNIDDDDSSSTQATLKMHLNVQIRCMIDDRIIYVQFNNFEVFQKLSKNHIFEKVVQAAFSVSFNLQMTSIDTCQSTSGCRDGLAPVNSSMRKQSYHIRIVEDIQVFTKKQLSRKRNSNILYFI